MKCSKWWENVFFCGACLVWLLSSFLSATQWWSSAGIQSRSGGLLSPNWCHAFPPSSPASAGSTTSCSIPPMSTSTRWHLTPPSCPPPPPTTTTTPAPLPHPTPWLPHPCHRLPHSFATWSGTAAPDRQMQRKEEQVEEESWGNGRKAVRWRTGVCTYQTLDTVYWADTVFVHKSVTFDVLDHCRSTVASMNCGADLSDLSSTWETESAFLCPGTAAPPRRSAADKAAVAFPVHHTPKQISCIYTRRTVSRLLLSSVWHVLWYPHVAQTLPLYVMWIFDGRVSCRTVDFTPPHFIDWVSPSYGSETMLGYCRSCGLRWVKPSRLEAGWWCQVMGGAAWVWGRKKNLLPVCSSLDALLV